MNIIRRKPLDFSKASPDEIKRALGRKLTRNGPQKFTKSWLESVMLPHPLLLTMSSGDECCSPYDVCIGVSRPQNSYNNKVKWKTLAERSDLLYVGVSMKDITDYVHLGCNGGQICAPWVELSIAYGGATTFGGSPFPAFDQHMWHNLVGGNTVNGSCTVCIWHTSSTPHYHWCYDSSNPVTSPPSPSGGLSASGSFDMLKTGGEINFSVSARITYVGLHGTINDGIDVDFSGDKLKWGSVFSC